MAIDQPYAFDSEELEHHLVQIEPEKVLCFAVSCAEHMAPTVALWSQQTFRDVDSAISECWETFSKTQPLNTLHIQNLEIAYQEVLAEIEHDFRHELSFIEDAIVCVIYMLEYAKSQQVNFAALCARRAYDLADQLACKTAIALTDQHPSDEILLASEPVQTELYQQQHLLDVLSSTPMDLLSVAKLRQEAQQTGVKFLQWIRNYCKLDPSTS